MDNQLLLLEDVVGLGRSGDIVKAKPGYIRNFLLPKKKAVIADRHTIKLQAKLQEERAKKASLDRKEAEKQAVTLKGLVLKTEVKVDTAGHMYGSVSSIDIARMLQEKEYQLERKHVDLPHPIKKLGTHSIKLRLEEGVIAEIVLEVAPEGGKLYTGEAATPSVQEETHHEGFSSEEISSEE
ncbi:MAG: 50S ribosomal protein L9 [Chlamydiia bacterium]|nr:50S ribosomal protein L9 [Chlamydiia bacterium]